MYFRRTWWLAVVFLLVWSSSVGADRLQNIPFVVRPERDVARGEVGQLRTIVAGDVILKTDLSDHDLGPYLDTVSSSKLIRDTFFGRVDHATGPGPAIVLLTYDVAHYVRYWQPDIKDDDMLVSGKFRAGYFAGIDLVIINHEEGSNIQSALVEELGHRQLYYAIGDSLSVPSRVFHDEAIAQLALGEWVTRYDFGVHGVHRPWLTSGALAKLRDSNITVDRGGRGVVGILRGEQRVRRTPLEWTLLDYGFAWATYTFLYEEHRDEFIRYVGLVEQNTAARLSLASAADVAFGDALHTMNQEFDLWLDNVVGRSLIRHMHGDWTIKSGVVACTVVDISERSIGAFITLPTLRRKFTPRLDVHVQAIDSNVIAGFIVSVPRVYQLASVEVDPDGSIHQINRRIGGIMSHNDRGFFHRIMLKPSGFVADPTDFVFSLHDAGEDVERGRFTLSVDGNEVLRWDRQSPSFLPGYSVRGGRATFERISD